MTSPSSKRAESSDSRSHAQPAVSRTLRLNSDVGARSSQRPREENSTRKCKRLPLVGPSAHPQSQQLSTLTYSLRDPVIQNSESPSKTAAKLIDDFPSSNSRITTCPIAGCPRHKRRNLGDTLAPIRSQISPGQDAKHSIKATQSQIISHTPNRTVRTVRPARPENTPSTTPRTKVPRRSPEGICKKPLRSVRRGLSKRQTVVRPRDTHSRNQVPKPNIYSKKRPVVSHKPSETREQATIQGKPTTARLPSTKSTQKVIRSDSTK